MKKLLISLFAIFGIVLSIFAWTTSGAFSCWEDGDLVGTLQLRSNGSYTLVLEGENYSGDYSIDREVTAGDTSIIRFTSDKGSFAGTYMWPTQEGICIDIEGYLFRKL